MHRHRKSLKEVAKSMRQSPGEPAQEEVPAPTAPLKLDVEQVNGVAADESPQSADRGPIEAPAWLVA